MIKFVEDLIIEWAFNDAQVGVFSPPYEFAGQYYDLYILAWLMEDLK